MSPLRGFHSLSWFNYPWLAPWASYFMSDPVQEKLQDPITRHMRVDPARLHTDQTVGDALEAVRSHPPEGRILYFYVVDGEGRLKGVVPTRRLLLSPLETPLENIMVREVVGLPDHATVLDACEFFTLHRLLALPVVDADRKLLGVVDVELYTSELEDLDRSQRSDDLFQLIGVHLAEAQQAAPLVAFWHRFPWLMTNIAAGIAAAFLSGMFEAELQRVVALAMFIPVVLALSESVSIQSVSLALQVLRGQQPTWKVIAQRLKSESVTGVLLGAVCGLIVATVAVLWQGDGPLAACLLGGIGIGVTASAAIGMAMPNVLRMFRRDPQVAAGPIALALADMVTLVAYLNLARWLL